MVWWISIYAENFGPADQNFHDSTLTNFLLHYSIALIAPRTEAYS